MFTRRTFLQAGLATVAGVASADEASPDVHRQLLDLAGRQEEARHARFAAIRSKDDLQNLQQALRRSFLRMLGGLPEPASPPPVRVLGTLDGDGYLVEKLVFESFPGYFVSALLYRPRQQEGPAPGVLSPCGHSAVGKAEATYQVLHVNLARRGYVVLTYDPVGQGERSQFWDAERGRSRFNLSCGEHAVLGNPLYLLGTNLARYRIVDGLRGLDYLASRPEVAAAKLGCVGNSGGGTLTAYLAALDSRILVAAVCCYLTTLPRRMGNRIETDPDADPEQDLFGFVSAGLDHAGLLALRVPRPTLVCSARRDFFPIEGARATFAEAKRLYETAGAGERLAMAEADENHGLTPPLRRAVYDWFARWLPTHPGAQGGEELPVTPRPAKELQVCAEGQVGLAFRSRPLLPLALEAFRKDEPRARHSLREVLHLDPDNSVSRTTELAAGGAAKETLVLCVNGNEGRGWRDQEAFLGMLRRKGYTALALDPRGVGVLRQNKEVRGRDYADPLAGVEENVAYNAFLVGKSLLGMRVTDVREAVRKATAERKPRRVVLCGRRDAALVACLAAAVTPEVTHAALEELPLSLLPLFEAAGRPINAASILPGLLRDYGDLSEVLAELAPRPVLVGAPATKPGRLPAHVRVQEERWSQTPSGFVEWLE